MREARFASLQPGKFRSFNGSSGIVFYAESVDEQGVLHNVYAERAVGGKLEIWTAKRAIQQGIGQQQQAFVLYEGQRYEGVPGSGEFRTIEFAEGGIPVSLPEVATASGKIEYQTTRSLLESTAPPARAELQQRLAAPVMALVLVMIAVPLSRLRPRQGRYTKVGYFILVYLLYKGLLVIAGDSMARGTVAGWLGMWWVHGLGLGLAAWLWWRAAGGRLIAPPVRG
jgi:lipopolysaccharide export system permease protein